MEVTVDTQLVALIVTIAIAGIGAQVATIKWLVKQFERRLEERLDSLGQTQQKLEGRLEGLEIRHTNLREDLSRTFVTNDHITQILTPLHWKIDALHKQQSNAKAN